MQPTFFNATVALILIVGVMVGVASLSRRLGLPSAFRKYWQTAPKGTRRSVRVDRGRVLSIVELDGVRFAILIGGRSDQVVVVPPSADRDVLS